MAKGFGRSPTVPPVAAPQLMRAKASGHERSSKAKPSAAALVIAGTGDTPRSSRNTLSLAGSRTTASGLCSARRATISETHSARRPRMGRAKYRGPMARSAVTPTLPTPGIPVAAPLRQASSLASPPPATPSTSARPAMLR